MDPGGSGYDPEGLPSNVFASKLVLLWHERCTGESILAIAEGREPNHDYPIAIMMATVRAHWPEADRGNFANYQFSCFRALGSDPTIEAELERRELSALEKGTISHSLRQISGEVDNPADFSRAIAVIAGLIGRYYSAEQRAAYIVDFIIDSSIDDGIDTDKPRDGEATHSDSARAISSAPIQVLTLRAIVQAGVLLIALVLPSAIAERFTPAVGPTYEAAIFIPAYAVIWLGLAAVYQGARGQIVIAWRCAFLACAVVCGAVCYFQTGWHWVEAKATSPESVAYQQDRLSRLDPTTWSGSDTAYVLKHAQIARDLAIATAKENYERVAASFGERHSTPFAATATPWFGGLLLACLLAASASRATIERILSLSHRHPVT